MTNQNQTRKGKTTKRTRRKIVELLGTNNGHTVGVAELKDESWHCEAFVSIDGYRSTTDRAVIHTRKAAEAWLRDVAEAASITACPAI